MAERKTLMTVIYFFRCFFHYSWYCTVVFRWVLGVFIAAASGVWCVGDQRSRSLHLPWSSYCTVRLTSNVRYFLLEWINPCVRQKRHFFSVAIGPRTDHPVPPQTLWWHTAFFLSKLGVDFESPIQTWV